MEVNPREMDSWFLILLVISVSVAWVDGQLDSNGFINIDCGRAPNTNFSNSYTKSTYVSDDQFIDTGENHEIDSKYAIEGLFEELLTVRSFPSGTRNCYTLRSLKVGTKYLVRGIFYYANYDNLNKPPTFDLHLGVNYWATMVTRADTALFTEIIATATSDYLQVCLVNKKLGTPFISDLHLSELMPTMYKLVNSTQSLVYFERKNLGASDYLRYPEDQYDRIWRPYTSNIWKNISTSSTIVTDTDFETPSAVLQTAATTLSTTQPLIISWSSDNTSTKFFVVLHSTEIGALTSTNVREFDIFANGLPVLNHSYVPFKLESDWISYTHTSLKDYNASLWATSRSTLPPLLNAYELYVVTAATGTPTNNADVTGVNAIKANYKVNKGWSGDPCVPTQYTWPGITCTSDSNNIPRITELDLSSSGLAGPIISSFGNLSSLKSLDLSNNDLTGDLPAFLDKLSSLTYLDITGNEKLSTTLPPGLQSKKLDGNLIFKFGSEAQNKKKSPVVIIVVVVGVIVLLITATIIIVMCLRRSKYENCSNRVMENWRSSCNFEVAQTWTCLDSLFQPAKQLNIPNPNDGNGVTPQEHNQAWKFANTPEESTSQGNNAGQYYANINRPSESGGILDIENRRYSYNDLLIITNKFQNHIGTGGFGRVYVGVDNGTQVAVKTRSHSSSQGVKEFLAEAQNLARVHHKYLVSLIGYCIDGDCMALVYEYMKEGTLQDKLMDNTRPLSWKQRVRIAYESALGLEYLHKACNPPLIHRDVKTSNILLDKNLEAKIADFGLSREFNNAASTHVSTAVVGTPGYLDPEYYTSYQLSEKSDVFSFGVVLLEIITGMQPIISGPEGGHLKEWVNKKLSRGDIESIVDPNIQGQYDINSVWKVTELARKCTDNSAAKRPTMSMVVTELNESLNLEISTEGTRGRNTANYRPHIYSRNENYVSDASQNSVFEMAYMGGMAGPGPEAR